MKKEIEGFIYEYHQPWLSEGVSMPFLPASGSYSNGGPRLKATLVIEMPEKKIQITESEWEEARDVWDTDLTIAKNLTAMKRKLFGDD